MRNLPKSQPDKLNVESSDETPSDKPFPATSNAKRPRPAPGINTFTFRLILCQPRPSKRRTNVPFFRRDMRVVLLKSIKTRRITGISLVFPLLERKSAENSPSSARDTHLFRPISDKLADCTPYFILQPVTLRLSLLRMRFCSDQGSVQLQVRGGNPRLTML